MGTRGAVERPKPMLAPTLLCQLRSLADLAYALPGCMPVGLILLVTAVLPLAANR
jgi:hypothetical protein